LGQNFTTVNFAVSSNYVIKTAVNVVFYCG